ncbi:hypothetical protein [Actinomadura flavalba]|uniref:hypothetical protein n=1 Tax=Actinomadura flavalba TaxID=1120938 RepID=UPI00036357C8|nr:hypothetical protein [Actinomadura flavalba]
MQVTFARTGWRRYATIVAVPGRPERLMNPAPGYDPDIPHDLVHYVVEAELRLTGGVYGRAAAGGGSFHDAGGGDARERRRAERRRRRKEDALRRDDHGTGDSDMARSERLAALCDVVWRRRHGQVPPHARAAALLEPGSAALADPGELPGAERAAVERIVARLDELAPRWGALEPGQALTFAWPDLAAARVDRTL